jgi:hypothetical protein
MHLGIFEIGNLVAGGMGEVYRARVTKPVARSSQLSSLRSNWGPYASARRQLDREPHEIPAPRQPSVLSATLRIEIHDDVVQLTQAGVNMSGKQESSTLTFNVDGVEHPIPQAPGFVSLCQWVGTHALESMGKKDGAVVGHGTYAVFRRWTGDDRHGQRHRQSQHFTVSRMLCPVGWRHVVTSDTMWSLWQPGKGESASES